MTKLQTEIVKKAKCNILDLTIKDKDLIKKDLEKRLKKMQKHIENVKNKAYEKGVKNDILEIMANSIENFKRTIKAVESIK